MRFIIPLCSTISIVTANLLAQQAAPANPPAVPAATAEAKTPLDNINNSNALRDAKLKADLAEMNATVERLKMEKNVLSETLAIAQLKQQAQTQEQNLQLQSEADKIQRDANKAKAQAELVVSEFKSKSAEWEYKLAKIDAEMKAIELNKQRENYADAKPVYLENPLKEDGTLVISDRRISMNGPVTYDTADHITERIHYYNNKNSKLPIFIVIDASPGGSVMAGYRILKAMEGSDAPVYVVVKSFAASMAAAITTLAKESYAYPNAIILHHQMSATIIGSMNLTQQKEFYENSQQWWTRLATPIATKMGVSTEEFIKKMYDKNTSGDWDEFGNEAQKLKWVNHIVHRIQETSTLKNPDAVEKKKEDGMKQFGVIKSQNTEGRNIMLLPRLHPRDVYFLYNPDQYYQLQ